MRSRTVLLSLLVVLLLVGGAFLFGAVVAFFSHAMSGDSRGWLAKGDGIGLVEIGEAIYDSKDVVELLEDFRTDQSVKAVIMRVNSPGGSVAASQEIYKASKKVAGEKPVIASMSTVAASGGYYVVLGATKVLANPGSITGSIGVRLDHVMLEDLLRWAKIRHTTLKSGRFKDIGTFDRPMTPEEKEILQALMDDLHNQFKEDIVLERKLSRDKVDELADGRIYTGREAYELGLVDELGGLVEAIGMAKKLGGIEGEPEIIEKKKFKYEWLGEMMESAASKLAEGFSSGFMKRSTGISIRRGL
jgi:protease-4